MNLDTLIIFSAGVCTLGIFSFLYKENRFYRLLEHIFIGIAAGYSFILTLREFLYPKILQSLLGLDIYELPDGTYNQEYNYYNLLYLIPIFFGLLIYFLYSEKHRWLGKLSIGISLGASGALAIKGIFNRLFPQIESSFKPLVVLDQQKNLDLLASFNNVVFVVTLLLVLNYFIFSLKYREKQKYLPNLGRYLLMLCFGAFFGSTVMARLALLVERVQFIYFDWLGLFFK